MNQDLIILIYSVLQAYSGGRETWLYNFLRSDARTRYRRVVVVYLSDGSSPIRSELERIGIEFKGATKRSNFRLVNWFSFAVASLSMALNLRVMCPRFIAVGSWYENLALSLVKLVRPGAVSVCWVRSIMIKQLFYRAPPPVSMILERLELWLLRRNDIVITNGQDTQDYYRTKGIDSFLIPNAVDINRVRKNQNALLFPPFVIMYAARLAPDKGIIPFIHAVELFSKHSPGIVNKLKFVVVGSGPLRDLLIEHINDGLPIDYLGPIENSALLERLSRVDATVHLTTSGRVGASGVSNALLESIMSQNLPICWDNPIYRQVLDRSQALMVDEENINALAEAFRQVANEPAELRVRVNNGRSLHDTYGFAEHVRKYLLFVENE